ncbi:MAG TPA: hypothetical protein VHP37_20145 [Burkholderiales bacterium]|nr:hypothetical protein [Burkholderiales bacterium]
MKDTTRGIRFALAAAAAICATLAIVACRTLPAQLDLDAADPAPPKRMVTQGTATRVVAQNLTKCAHTNPKMNVRVAAVGEIAASDGTVLTMPAATALQRGEGPLSHDLYNECNQVTPANAAAVSTANVPVIEIDPDGVVVTGFIVADNYYEMYVNGKLVSVDNTPYTPFNSAIVKFRVKRPYTMAFLVVDWDEHLGVGMEVFPVPVTPKTNKYYPGDGGLIAKFSDGTVTDSTWKAQSFYIAPLVDPREVVDRGHIHDTPNLGGRTHPYARRPTCEDKCYAVHYAIPANWQSPRYDDRYWPRAWEFTDQEIGVTNLPAYTRYPELFEGARWIWSQNLVLDNVVIARKTVR